MKLKYMNGYWFSYLVAVFQPVPSKSACPNIPLNTLCTNIISIYCIHYIVTKEKKQNKIT